MKKELRQIISRLNIEEEHGVKGIIFRKEGNCVVYPVSGESDNVGLSRLNIVADKAVDT